MNEGKILDSLKDLLDDKDSMLNLLKAKLQKKEAEYNCVLLNESLSIAEKENLLMKTRAEINVLNDKILNVFSGSIESLKKQKD